MTDAEIIRKIKTIIKACDEAVEQQEKYGSRYGVECAKETAFDHIYKLMKEEDNGQ